MDLSMQIFAFILLVVAAVSYAVSPHVDWNAVLPNTPMPSAISHLLYPGEDQKTGTTVNVGHGGVHVSTGNGHSGTHVNVGYGGVDVNTGNGKHKGTSVNVGYGGVNVHTSPSKKPVDVNTNGFHYLYAASDDQLKESGDVAVFFLERDLHAGAKMNLHFIQTGRGAAFIPHQLAEKMPFSSKKLPEILGRFRIQPNSDEARIVANTLEMCEAPVVAGETSICATSLESMVDFSISSLSTHDVVAISTTVEKENTPKQVYTISGIKKIGGSKAVACHAEPYVYAVFFCHSTSKTRVYEVTMVAVDGSKVEAAAVCHNDTARWNPKHLAFQLLHVRPGAVPVCHFLPEDHVVWTPAN